MESGKLRIFIGSSSEAIDLARHAETIISGAGMTATRWDGAAFAPGRTLLEQIEDLPFDYDGAVLIATPDLVGKRGSRIHRGPVANVIFEYGYLSARLARGRVIICRFQNAELPSDAAGVKVLDARKVEGPTGSIPHTMVLQLRDWLSRLPQLADSTPATVQLHGYSGRWRVRNSFDVWHSIPLDALDTVYFDGSMMLSIHVSGKSGMGIMYGETYISIGTYRATIQVVNEIREAVVTQQGVLKLTLEVVRRDFRNETGEPPPVPFRQAMQGSEFNVDLAPVPGEPKLLRGTHSYRRNLAVYSSATEEYLQVD